MWMVIISMKLFSLPLQMSGLMTLASFQNSGSVCFSALSTNGQNIQSSCENLKLVHCELKICLFLGCACNAYIVSFVDRISFGMCGRFTAAEIMAFCLSFMIVCVWILTGHWLLMDGKLMHTDTAAHTHTHTHTHTDTHMHVAPLLPCMYCGCHTPALTRV